MTTRIAHIKGVNLKGRTFTHDLEPVTVFTGGNGAGKTACVDTIMLALAGAHPKLGKQNGALFRLSSGSVMAAHATMKDGRVVERRWTEKKGSISMEQIGSDMTVPPVALDAAEYFGMNDRDRLALVFRISGGATGEYGPNIAAKTKAIKLDEPTAETEKLCATIAAEIMEDWTKRKEGTPAQWLDEFAGKAKAKQSESTAAVKRMTGAAAGIAELRSQANRPAQDAERVREREQAAYNDLAAEHSRVEGRLNTVRETEQRRKAATEQLACYRQQAEKHEATRAELRSAQEATANRSEEAPLLDSAQKARRARLAEMSRRNDDLSAEAEKATRQTESRAEFEAILDLHGDNETVLTESHEFITFIAPKAESYRNRVPECEQAVSSANKSEAAAKAALDNADEKLSALLKQRERLAHAEACPYCKSTGTAWKSTLTAEIESELSAASLRHVAAIGAHDTALAASLMAEEELEAAREQHAAHEQLQAKLTEARSNLALAEAEKRRATEGMKLLTARSADAIQRDIDENNAQAEKLDAEIEAAEPELEAARQRDAELFSKRSLVRSLTEQLNTVFDYKSAIARLEGELATLPPKTDEEQITAVLRSIAEAKATAAKRLEEAKQAEKQLIASRAEAATKLKAAEKAEAIRVEADIWKQVRQFVEDEQAEAVAAAFKPLLTTANRIAGAVLKSPLAYRNGELGRMDGRTWVSHHTFSGSEQAVTYAAISVALAANSPLRIAIVDELDRLTTENKQALMEAVVDAIQAGTLDQFIGADVRPTDYAGLNQVAVINL